MMGERKIELFVSEIKGREKKEVRFSRGQKLLEYKKRKFNKKKNEKGKTHKRERKCSRTKETRRGEKIGLGEKK